MKFYKLLKTSDNFLNESAQLYLYLMKFKTIRRDILEIKLKESDIWKKYQSSKHKSKLYSIIDEVIKDNNVIMEGYSYRLDSDDFENYDNYIKNQTFKKED
jgi:hypothetical protein